MTAADPTTPPPAAVAALAAGEPLRPVWRNQLGGLTFQVGEGGRRRFVKWAPAGSDLDLAAEADRLRWAGPLVLVPPVLGQGADEAGTWLVTAALPGRSAVDPAWVARPEVAVRAIGAGLRALHDALPVDRCPFTWSAEDRLARARAAVAAGRLDRSWWHADHRHLGVDEALGLVAEPPPVDRLVVCHGDPCCPNTLVADDGAFAGHVDLGRLGVADRWADLAVATWATTWNYGPGFEGPLLEAYGIDPDPERTAWYRLLWDLG